MAPASGMPRVKLDGRTLKKEAGAGRWPRGPCEVVLAPLWSYTYHSLPKPFFVGYLNFYVGLYNKNQPTRMIVLVVHGIYIYIYLHVTISVYIYTHHQITYM